MAPDARDPIAITGTGSICGLGIGTAAFERALFSGASALEAAPADPVTGLRPHLEARIAAFDPAAFLPAAKLRRVDRVGRLALAATQLALADAGVTTDGPSGVAASDIGVALGTATAGLHSVIDFEDRLIAHGATGASALDFSNTVGNAAASLCGIEFGLRGPNVTLSYREASALAAIHYGTGLVRAGRARAVVSGGADDFEPLFVAVHDRFGVLATDAGDGEASRPFDRRRNGFVVGNGAFLIAMEPASAATDRGATVAGYIAGVAATSSDAEPGAWTCEPAELVRCMQAALDDAQRSTRDVGVVFAAANSTTGLDRVEAAALASLFGTSGVPVVALKGALGECGAIGAAGVIAATVTLRQRRLPPTVGFAERDPACPVDVAPVSRPLAGGARPVALVNSFASGGAHFSVVVSA